MGPPTITTRVKRRLKMEMGWNEKTNEKIVLGHIKPVNCLCVMGNQVDIASGSDDKTIHVWETERPDLSPIKCVLKGHTAPVLALCCLGDGFTLASGSMDRTIKLWDTKKGECTVTLVGNLGYIRHLMMLKVLV